MNSRLNEVLEGKHGNYIMPLVWQRGESEAVIREELTRIDEAGIKAFVVESRPHPDCLGPGWWADLDIIMDEARKRNMRVWAFDDDHFPTGHANGRLKEAPAELRRMFIAERHIDAMGPAKDASFLLSPWLAAGESLIAVIAAKRSGNNGELTGELIDVSAQVQDHVLYWEIPEGLWRIFVIVRTQVGPDEKYKDYVNPLVAESVRVLIDASYVPYYERYRDDFGRTFAGFFTDEPGFYNDGTIYDFESKLGKKRVSLPWSPDMLPLLDAEFGTAYLSLLPLLWYEANDELTGAVRFAYMNVVSRLYAEHFSGQIGAWCRYHGVEHIGHIIEDNNVHARLGCGSGHFFRSMSGQDMSGVDVVLHQLIPGFDEASFSWIAGDTDSEFFHYGLAKLASSLGHIDPKKKGRTMAEVFGAYGWAEGLKLMKWLTDHMLVRGVNYFVPHAFSQKEFPDGDCPPHLYARGHNPQYRSYKILNDYTNRMSHLLTGGRHRATAAVLYHAEGEWSGSAMYFHKPVKELMRHQVDCDVLPVDALLESAEVANGKLQVGMEDYDVFIVPYADALPAPLLTKLVQMANLRLPIVFVDGLPLRSSQGTDIRSLLSALKSSPSVNIVALSELAAHVKEQGYIDVSAETYEPYLRYYRYEQPGLDLFFFVNEHPNNAIETKVHLSVGGELFAFDGLQNELLSVASEGTNQGSRVSLTLSPYESILFIAGPEAKSLGASFDAGQRDDVSGSAAQHLELQGPWTISTADALSYPNFEAWGTMAHLANMSSPDRLPRFSGTFRYESVLDGDYADRPVKLDLGSAYETVDVWVNGDHIRSRICPPYSFDIGRFLLNGKNNLKIEVTNTLAKQQHDFFSRFMQQEPSGLLGPVTITVGDKRESNEQMIS
ncbi:glycosyl transferase family 2 [Paenibacillus sp. GCM10027628]